MKILFLFLLLLTAPLIYSQAVIGKKPTVAPKPKIVAEVKQKDSDGDGITDTKDKCPDAYGESKYEGCPDSNGDGIIDIEDTDGDGIRNIKDVCPDLKGSPDYQGCLPLMRERFTLSGHTKRVMAIDFSPNSKLLVSGGNDNMIKGWDTENGKCLFTVESDRSGYVDWVKSVNFSPDGKQFVSGGSNQLVKIWNTETGAIMDSFFVREEIEICKWSNDGKYIIVAGWFEMVQIWDLHGKLIKIISGKDNDGIHSSGVSNTIEDVFFPAVEEAFYYSTGNGEVYRVDLETQKKNQLYKAENKELTGLMYRSEISNQFWLSGFGSVASLELTPQPVKHNFPISNSSITSILGGLSALYVSNTDGEILLFDVIQKEVIQKTTAHSKGINVMCRSKNEKLLATGSNDNTIKIWKLKD